MLASPAACRGPMACFNLFNDAYLYWLWLLELKQEELATIADTPASVLHLHPPQLRLPGSSA